VVSPHHLLGDEARGDADDNPKQPANAFHDFRSLQLCCAVNKKLPRVQRFHKSG
jgi:hypothetical protein